MIITLVYSSLPVDPLTVALLLKAEIVDCFMLRKRVCLHHTMHTPAHIVIIIIIIITAFV